METRGKLGECGTLCSDTSVTGGSGSLDQRTCTVLRMAGRWIQYLCAQVSKLFRGNWRSSLFVVGFGCDETELLGEGVIHGRSRSMFQGAVYR